MDEVTIRKTRRNGHVATIALSLSVPCPECRSHKIFFELTTYLPHARPPLQYQDKCEHEQVPPLPTPLISYELNPGSRYTNVFRLEMHYADAREESREMATDNAVSALGNLLEALRDSLSSPGSGVVGGAEGVGEAWGVWLGYMPLGSDEEEAEKACLSLLLS